MNAVAVKRPVWFWVVAVLALVWNVIGVAMAWMQYSMTPDQLARLSEAQRTVHEAMPGWLWAVDFVAVGAGLLGAVLLLMGKRLALPLFWLSLVAVVVLFGYCLFPGRMIELLGAAQALPMPILVTVIALFLVWFARKAIARGWLA